MTPSVPKVLQLEFSLSGRDSKSFPGRNSATDTSNYLSAKLMSVEVAVHGLNSVELEMNEVATERHIQDSK